MLGPWPLPEVPLHLMDVLAATRLPTVLLFSGLVAAMYFLARRLVGRRPRCWVRCCWPSIRFGLGLSRVIDHDALSAIFMTASFLTFAHWLTSSRWTWAAVSGVGGGLAVLSKSTALFLGPAICAMALAYGLTHKPALPWKRAVLGLLCWGLVVVAVFSLLWPAMWVDPVGTVQGVMDKAPATPPPRTSATTSNGQLLVIPGPLSIPWPRCSG